MRLSKIHIGAWGAALATAAIFGVSTPIAKVVVEQIPPFIVLFLRFTIAAFTFIPFLWVADQKKPIQTHDFFRLAFFGFLGSTVATGAAFEGIARTSILDAAVILATIPIIEAIASGLFFKEKYTKLQKIGFLVALFGTLFVIGEPLINFSLHAQERLIGNLLMLLSNNAFVAFSLGSKSLLRRYSPTHVAGVMFCVGMVSIAPIALYQYLQGTTWLPDVSTITLSGILFLAIATTIFAHVLWEWALSRSMPGKVGLAMYATPIFAGIIAIPFFGEIPNAFFLVGTLCIIIGIILGLRHTHDRLPVGRRARPERSRGTHL
ncbi:MAG: DMT family transporter [bacterium]|nr:DMT family transporter [bacterium]